MAVEINNKTSFLLWEENSRKNKVTFEENNIVCKENKTIYYNPGEKFLVYILEMFYLTYLYFLVIELKIQMYLYYIFGGGMWKSLTMKKSVS